MGLLFLVQQTINRAHGNPRKSERLLGSGSDGTGEARGGQSCPASAALPGLRRGKAPFHFQTPGLDENTRRFKLLTGSAAPGTMLLQGWRGGWQEERAAAVSCLHWQERGEEGWGRITQGPERRFHGGLCIFFFLFLVSVCMWEQGRKAPVCEEARRMGVNAESTP